MNSNSQTPNKLFQDKNFYIANAVTLVAIMGGIVIAPILPLLGTSFRVEPHQVELVMTVFLIPAALMTPLCGVLVDRIGRKQILIPSLLLFAIAGGFAAFAQDFTTLLICRFVQGLGVASLELSALTIMGDLYRGKQIVTAMSFNAALIGFSSTFYPLIGGLLGGVSWRYPFLLSVVAFPMAFLAWMVLKLPKQQQKVPQASLGQYFKLTIQSVSNRAVVGLFCAIAAVFVLDFGIMVTYIPILVGTSFKAAAWITGVILASKAVSMSLLASRLEALAHRFSPIALIRLSFVVSAIALAVVPAIHNVWLLVIPSMIFGVAQCLALPPSQALLAGLGTRESRGGVMAVNATVQAVGQALGPILAGIAFSLWGMQGVFFASAGFALIASTVFNYLVAPRQSVEFPKAQSAIHEPPMQMSQPPQEAPAAVAPPIRTQAQPLDLPPARTILQLQKAQLVNAATNEAVALPSTFPVIHIGKPNDRIPPDIDLSLFPNSQVVSRVHADIRVEGENYYLQDAGSANGTFLNNVPLLPGNWYKLKAGDRITFGKGRLVNFLFQISE